MRTASTCLVVFWLAVGAAWGQGGQGGQGGQDGNFTADEVRGGHQLALKVCAVCHLAAPDQGALPLMKPPAPSFASIVQRPDVSADSLRIFMTTTHRGLDEPNGMPNPDLADYQVKQAVAYLLSLRK